MRQAARTSLIILAISVATASTAPLIFWMAADTTNLASLVRTFRYSLVYSLLTTTLGHLVIPGICHRIFASRLAPWRQQVVLAAALVGVGLAGSVLGTLFLWVAQGMSLERALELFWIAVRMCVVLTLAFGSAITLYRVMRVRFERAEAQLQARELEHERALKLATEAQLASLESRIHPHFLFNALNSISALIPEDPARAERLLERMAALLRFSLDSGRRGAVSLAQEMRIVTDYLEIEKARFGERLRYSIHVPLELGSSEVPPLAIQMLVENAVKHVIARSPAGGSIRVAAARTPGGALRIEVADSGPGFDLSRVPAGHGIDNLRGRLSALFGAAASLTVERREAAAAVCLELPQPQPQPQRQPQPASIR